MGSISTTAAFEQSGVRPTAAAGAWMRGSEGLSVLQQRARECARAFGEVGLKERLQREMAAAQAGGTKVYRIGNSLRNLSHELAMLSFAHGMGVATEGKAWEVVLGDYLPMVMALEEVSFQGRNHNPPWKSDLWTADIGGNLALAMSFESPLTARAGQVAEFVREKCLRPILADWVEDGTRLHSLDSMGHNWWAVIVGAAGIMAEALGDRPGSERIAEGLIEWMHFPGRELSRKRPNFGAEGDFVEGFSYGEYALLHVCGFAHLNPSFKWIPDGLSLEQARGLADWFKSAFVPTSGGLRAQRFGDVHCSYEPRAAVWHSLARETNDSELLALAHVLRPKPHDVVEFLLWEPATQAAPAQLDRETLRVYPTSGLAFARGRRLSLSVRAGEAWNHNHMDAGSFIFHQDDVIWVDDCGTCAYSRPEYVDYYVTAGAHNVAYAPALCPPPRPALWEGHPVTGRYLSSGQCGGVKVLAVDSGIVSGGALARSLRWFFVLGEDAVVVWDDLAAHQPQEFSSLLHTGCEIGRGAEAHSLLLRADGRECRVEAYCDAAFEIDVQKAHMGGREDAPGEIEHIQGQCIALRSAAAQRIKFAWTLGTQLKGASWQRASETSGWEGIAQTEQRRWRIWFNPLADGRAPHRNCISGWDELETDAYALIEEECGGERRFTAVEASFVRRRGEVLFGQLRREGVVGVKSFV